ncbi:MAG: ribose-5-phosphate isomerase RpiA [Planctomycetia bacterium]|nr:ribose-5-phosphate isomerase RpiA [Planctomycetia bacterium]
MTIYERALELIPNDSVIGLGSGRAAWAFVELLGKRVQTGGLRVRGVPTSDATAELATRHGIPLVTLADADTLAVTVDGADEVDPDLNLIKGYGRALLREKIVAASSQRLVILVGEEKLVPKLGTRGKLPVEVVPFAVPLCTRRLRELGTQPTLWGTNNQPSLTDNGNNILECAIEPIPDAAKLEADIQRIPGVVGTGLFLKMADVVLVGDNRDFRLVSEKLRSA